MSTVDQFGIAANRFQGALPASGLRAMRAVTHFTIYMNGFKGTLPERGITSMSAVTEDFDIRSNSFEGTLPGSGLQVMRAVYAFLAEENYFAGTLPNDGFRALAKLDFLTAVSNDFEGAIPSSLDVQVAAFSHNLLGGPLPQRLFGGSETFQKCVIADALFHEGTIPESASRLTAADIKINIGHGLRGLLPSIPGTVGLLSLGEN
eukprot:4238405-Amphidinium_carterae.1